MKTAVAFVTGIVGLVLMASDLAQGQFSPTPFPQNYNRPYDQRYNPDYYGRKYAILRQNHEQNIDGSYRYSYDTENGISVAEQGQPSGGRGPEGPAEVVQGRYSYVAPDGQQVSLQYVADEGGFRAQGSHIPTPPPIPPEIQRALAYNAAHPEEDHGDFAGSGRPYNHNNYNNYNYPTSLPPPLGRRF